MGTTCSSESNGAAATTIDETKLALARQHGAEVTVNAGQDDPAAMLHDTIGGAHGALVTAVSTAAFKQALAVVRRGATITFNGLPAGEFGAVDLRRGAAWPDDPRLDRRHSP